MSWRPKIERSGAQVSCWRKDGDEFDQDDFDAIAAELGTEPKAVRFVLSEPAARDGALGRSLIGEKA